MDGCLIRSSGSGFWAMKATEELCKLGFTGQGIWAL